MNTLSQNPYRDITPEELHLALRRAHVERAKAVRQILASLLTWRRKAVERRQAETAPLSTAACH